MTNGLATVPGRGVLKLVAEAVERLAEHLELLNELDGRLADICPQNDLLEVLRRCPERVSGWPQEIVKTLVIVRSLGAEALKTADLAQVVPLGHVAKLWSAADSIRAALQGNDHTAAFVPADTLGHDHGITRNRLSEAVKLGQVRSKPAPRGTLDSQGRRVRRLYNRREAVKSCNPERVLRPR